MILPRVDSIGLRSVEVVMSQGVVIVKGVAARAHIIAIGY